MKWSWKIGEFRGIGVYMHATFLILIAFVVMSHWSAGHSVGKFVAIQSAIDSSTSTRK